MMELSVPHFVGIGSARCGTTWAFKMLRLHPGVWIPWKEMHFFDSIDPETDSGFDISDKRFRFHFGWNYALRRLAASMLPGASAITRKWFPLKAVHAPGLAWTARYFLGEATLPWYESLFREGVRAGLRCGEITPGYFMLSPRAIDSFARALPATRAFVMLRNPVDWAWSDVCKRIQDAGGDPASMSTDELIARCAVPKGRSWPDLGSNLARWLDHFPRDRLFIGFYDEIKTEPGPFFDRLCAFLGLAPMPDDRRRFFGERINSSARGMKMPPEVRLYAARQYRGEAAILADRLGEPAKRWLEAIDATLGGAGLSDGPSESVRDAARG